MSFRLEYATSARSGCKATECKSQGIKIDKNELRHVSFFTIDGERQGKAYRHWGCVTPRQIANLKKAIEGNLDYLDGYDDLNDDDKAKVRQALADGHVADEDWRYDPEMNRPGKIGFRSPAKKAEERAAKKAAEEQDRSGSPSKPAPKKRRARAKIEDDSEAESEVEVIPKKKSRAAPKKVKNEGGDEAEVEMKPEKKPRTATKIKKEDNSDADAPAEPRPRKKVKEEKDAGAETSTKAKPKKSKAASTKVKTEVFENKVPSADNAPAKASGRQAKERATNVKVERSASGEEEQGGSEVQEEVAASQAKTAGKKAASTIVTGSSATTKVKKEEEDSNEAFEVSAKARGGRRKKASGTSTAEAPSKDTATIGPATRSTGRVTRSSKA
ncbi:hypothetical protein MMC30_008200 [Trapelia coarctata]|nr:hypothetical protein [Trapelia coarctata]